ncbi:MAG: DNA gyrase inhibitor YacG [Proteobacteria bacterium]|nr:DNA gyrase inhibitor YacG [Pseudomonadota bacterium]
MTRPSKTCPICKKSADKEYTPFCSNRCAEVDLGHWLGGRYRIPTSERPETLAANDEDED